MKTSHSIIAVLLTAATLGGTAIAASSNADRANSGDDWLTIPGIYEKVVAAGFKDIYEIERERGGYDVEAYDSNGDRVELFVDPINGEVIDVRVKKNKSDKYRDQRLSDKPEHSSDR